MPGPTHEQTLNAALGEALDGRLLIDVLGLPESLCAENGPLDLLRRKLAREPQIHGGKKSRVVFDEARDRMAPSSSPSAKSTATTARRG